MEEEQVKTPPQRPKSHTKRIVWGFVLTLLILFVLLPASLYIPVVQDAVCELVVAFLNTTDDDLEYSVGKVRIGFPLRLKVLDVDVKRRRDGLSLLHIGSLQTGLDELPVGDHRSLVVNKFMINDVAVDLDSLTTSLGLVGKLDRLEAERLVFDPSTSDIQLNQAVIEGPRLTVDLGVSEPDTTDEANPWKVQVGRVVIKEGDVLVRNRIDTLHQAPESSLTAGQLIERRAQAPAPLLYDTLADIRGLGLVAENILYDSAQVQVDLRTMAAREAYRGIELTQLALHFGMRDEVIKAQGIDLQMAPRDYLRGDLSMHLGMLDSIPRGAIDAGLDLAIDSSNLVGIASPYLPALKHHWVDRQSRLVARGRVTPDSLSLPRLSLVIPDYVELNAEGLGDHIFDNRRRSAAATLKGSLDRADFLLSAFVDEPAARDYRLPDSLELDMDGAQRGERFSARLDVMQRGNNILSADVNYDVPMEAYHLVANAWGLKVSDFVSALPVSSITMRAHADGRHFALPSLQTTLEGQLCVDTLYYLCPDGRRDSLMGIQVDASMLGGNYLAEVHSNHPTLKVDTRLEGCYLKDSVSARGYFDVPFVDLAHLPYGYTGESTGQLGFRSKINASYNWDDCAEVTLNVDSLSYHENEFQQRFDGILVRVETEPGILDADVSGGDALLCVRIDHGLQELPAMIDTLVSVAGRQIEQMSFDPELLQRCLPKATVDFSMARDNPFYSALHYHTGYTFDRAMLSLRNQRVLEVDGIIEQLHDESGSIDFDTIMLAVSPELESGILFGSKTADDPMMSWQRRRGGVLGYGFRALHVDPKASSTYDIALGGELMRDSLTAALSYVNGKFLTVYDVAASLALRGDTLNLHLEKDPTLYEQPFTVNPENYVQVWNFRHMPETKPETSAKVLLDGPRDLKLNLYTRRNPKTEVGNQLLLLVRNLDLGYATHLMEWEGDAGGRFNMTAMVDLFPDSLNMRLRSGVKSFHLSDYRVDSLSFDGGFLMAHNQRDVTGKLMVDSIVKLNVDCNLADSLDLRVGIDELPMQLVNAFLPTNMRMWGNADGELTMRGPDMDHARMDGAFVLNDAGVNYADLDANLRFAPDTIRLRNNRLRLRDYKLYASNDNPVNLRGSVDFRQSLSNPGIDLSITGERVRLINNKSLRLKEQYITGRLPLSPDIRVRGTVANLNVTGSLHVLTGTKLDFYMQDDPLQSSSRVEQLVEFADFRQVDHALALGERRPRQLLQDQVDEGLNVELRIDIDKDVKVIAHLSGTANDQVQIVGGGSLNMQCDADGNLVMTGTYQMTNGYVDYKLPILPMVKTFEISNASNVSWEGDPVDEPKINIIANENVKATVSDGTGTRLVNFVVSIHITGTLDALNLTFDCDAPEDGAVNSDISTLTDDERSKAALMLLIAQTYIGPGNNSSVGLGTANAALNSMLNRQMDSMLGNMKGTNIDLGIDTYSTEQGNTRTNYSVKVSQNLFNDRFRATIGGEINSGGDVGQSRGARLGDMSLEWLIKKDGSHYMKLFRRTNYESVLEGELIETGISYVQERSAYRFKHLLLPTNRKLEERIRQMAREMQDKEQEEERRQRRSRNENNQPVTHPEQHVER